MAVTFSSSLCAGLALLLLAAGSCRGYDLCEGAKCSEVDLPVSGGVAGAVSPPLSSGGVANSEAGNDTGGEGPVGGGGDGGDGGAASEPAAEPLQCEVSTGDCDNSRLTGCESHLRWTVRHCGACGASCDDACSAGKCLPSSQLSLDSLVGSFVSTKTFAFATMSKLDGTHFFARIRVDTGKIDDLGHIGYGVDLHLGDRVYLFDDDSSEIRSVMLDGTDPRLETWTEPVSMAAYPGGTYYIGWPEEVLYYRPSVDSPWQELKRGSLGTLVSSSVYGVVYSEHSEEEGEQLYLLQKDVFVPFGEAPLNMDQALATKDGIAVLTFDYDTLAVELWWLAAGTKPRHYSLPPSTIAPRMRPDRDLVAVKLTEGKAAYVETFAPDGPPGERIGVRLGSDLVGLDERHLWHLVADDWFHWRFLSTERDLFGF